MPPPPAPSSSVAPPRGRLPVPVHRSALSCIKNGAWEEDTPIALAVSQSEFHKDSALKQVESRLKSLPVIPGYLPSSDLDITPSEYNDKGHVRTVRVSWKPVAWRRQTYLVEEMERVRRHLNDKGLYANWACSAENDQRRVGQFQFYPTAKGADISADEAVSAVEAFCGVNYKLLGTKAVGFKKDEQPGPRYVEIIAADPGSIAKLVPQVTAHMKNLGNQKFFGHSFRVSFRQTPNVVPIEYPTTLVLLGQGSIPLNLLEKELKFFIDQYNENFKTSEHLRGIGGTTKKVESLNGHAIAVPSSMDLAQYIARQALLSGPPWELAYHANAHQLSATKHQLAQVREDMRDGVPLEIKDSVDKMHARFAKLDAAISAIASDVHRLVTNFVTFGRDLYSNLHQLFSQTRRAIDSDAETTAQTLRMVAHEMEARDLQREIDWATTFGAKLGDDSAVGTALKERADVAKEQKLMVHRKIVGIQESLGVLKVQRDGAVSLKDQTGLGLTQSSMLALPMIPTAPTGAAPAPAHVQLKDPTPPAAAESDPVRPPGRDDPSPPPGSPKKKARQL